MIIWLRLFSIRTPSFAWRERASLNFDVILTWNLTFWPLCFSSICLTIGLSGLCLAKSFRCSFDQILGLSNFYSYTRCSYATNIFTITIKFSIKKTPRKTSFFVAEGKSTEGQRKSTPTAAPCGLSSYPVLATGSQEHHCFHTTSVLQLLVHHLSNTRAGPPHTLLVIDALGSWQIRASFLQA